MITLKQQTRPHICAIGLVAAAAIAIGLSSAAKADGFSRAVQIVNGSGATLTHVYASNTASAGWSQNKLGRGSLRPGQSASINFDDGSGACAYQIRVEFAGGAGSKTYQVDVCSVASYTFY